MGLSKGMKMVAARNGWKERCQAGWEIYWCRSDVVEGVERGLAGCVDNGRVEIAFLEVALAGREGGVIGEWIGRFAVAAAADMIGCDDPEVAFV